MLHVPNSFAGNGVLVSSTAEAGRDSGLVFHGHWVRGGQGI